MIHIIWFRDNSHNFLFFMCSVYFFIFLFFMNNECEKDWETSIQINTIRVGKKRKHTLRLSAMIWEYKKATIRTCRA